MASDELIGHVPEWQGPMSVQEAIELLREPGAVNYRNLAGRLLIDGEEVELMGELRSRVTDHVLGTLMAGHFGDLGGCRVLMSRVGIGDEAEKVFGEIADTVNGLLPRTQGWFWVCQSYQQRTQSVIAGEVDVEVAREVLGRHGFSDDELEDDRTVTEIMSLRFLLNVLQERGVEMIGGVEELLVGGGVKLVVGGCQKR